MAVENDDFDVEIDEVCFEIENEGWEAPVDSCSSTVQDDDTEEKLSRNNDLRTTDHVDTRVDIIGSAVSIDHSMKALNNHNINSGNSDAQMDDGFDDILSQIDEVAIKKMKTSKDTSGSTNGNGYTSHNTELSFFSSQDDTIAHPPMKRRFPGPAGLLPHLQKRELKFINMTPHPLYQKVSKLVSQTSENNSNSHSTSMRFNSAPVRSDKDCGGGSEILLSKAPWKKMVKSLNLNIKDENDLLNIVNIKWLRSKARKFPEEMKIPFLAVVVQGTLDANSSKKELRYKNPSVKLMDPTGTIVAAFNPNFVDTYGDKIVPGTALALRNCRVLTLKKHVILTVTKKNLLYLATTRTEIPEEEHKAEIPDSKTETPEFKTEKDVFEIKNGPLILEKILEDYNDISKKLNGPKANFQNQSEMLSRANGESPENDVTRRPSLFSTVSSARNLKTNESPFAPQLVPEQSSIKTAANALNEFKQKSVLETANFSADASSAFDDDDDEELLQALECVDFVIDEDSM